MLISELFKILPLQVYDDPIMLGIVDGYSLAAPESFFQFQNQDMSDVVNGCGAGGVGDFLVPDTMWGLSVKPACKVHDWMFTIFNSEDGFKLANQIFLDNMVRIINKKSGNNFIRWLRTRRAYKYFKAVEIFGRQHYYDAHVDLYSGQVVYS